MYKVTAISVGQGKTKSRYIKIFNSCYLVEFFACDHKGFKITFSNINSHTTPLLISRGWRKRSLPSQGFVAISDHGAIRIKSFYSIHLRFFLAWLRFKRNMIKGFKHNPTPTRKVFRLVMW